MSQNLLVEPTAPAQWKQLLALASQQSDCRLHEDVESYLIFTLMRFTREPHLASSALGPALLNCNQLQGQAKQDQLRNVGDQCLLLTGLFPHLAEKRLVQVSYYVDIGMTAYQYLGTHLRRAFGNLYQLLSQNFVIMMDVLQNIRRTDALQPLQALDLWQQTGSAAAEKIVKNTTKSNPIIIDKPIRH